MQLDDCECACGTHQFKQLICSQVQDSGLSSAESFLETMLC